MLDVKMDTLLAVAEEKSFTKAAERLSLTQPAVSHHIRALEEELGTKLIIRGQHELKLTPQGEIAVHYARRFQAMYAKLRLRLSDSTKHISNLRIGITHTAENNMITEVLAKYSNSVKGMTITIITDTIKNLYDKLENYELDLAIVEGKPSGSALFSLMLDTDYLVCVVSNNHPLAHQSMVTLNELKKERMIMRLPTSATRVQFEATLESMNDSISNYNVILEVDNIATIKDLIRKDLGVSILAKSACMDELRKGKITALPIENLSMIRETNIVYHKDFTEIDILKDISKLYQESKKAL